MSKNNIKQNSNTMESNINDKIYLHVPYEFKDEAKKLGSLWDPNTKNWYVYKNHKNYVILYHKFHFSNFRIRSLMKYQQEHNVDRWVENFDANY